MADKKIEKALYGPSMTEVALGAVLGLFAGVLTAGVYLVFKPVAQVKELPAETLRSVVYYIPGSELSGKARGWQAKQKQILAGNPLSLSLVEEELNAWGNTIAVPMTAKAPGTPPGEAAKPAVDGIFNPGKPNFRIVGDKLQIGAKCVLNWYGLTREVTVITTGTFAKSGDTVVYQPETIYLGSCPLHLLPALGGPLVSHLISREKIPDEVRAGWAKLDSVTIEGGALKLVAQ
jgi:hypothetical protein